MKIILYGIGQGLELVEKKIKKEHEISGYTDSFASLTIFKGKPFYRLGELYLSDFDYIVITIRDRKIAWEIYNMLIKDYGLTSECIIPYYVYANYARYKTKIRNCDVEKVQGLIFGNSHAMWGFLEKELFIPFLNFAIPWQDIYYNYEIFRNCIIEYGEQLKNLHYIIIDLYDYCYFNLDTSRTSDAINYVFWGGIPKKHNFDKNHNFKKSFDEELADKFCVLQIPPHMYQLFDDIDADSCDLAVLYKWNYIEKKGVLARGPIIGSTVLKRSEATIKENKKLIELFLKEIYNFNKEIKIVFTLIPRYIEMEKATEIIAEPWKNEFNTIVSDLCAKYDAVFLNYKYRKELSENHMFYYDPEHMNTIGARALTSILNEDLIKLNRG